MMLFLKIYLLGMSVYYLVHINRYMTKQSKYCLLMFHNYKGTFSGKNVHCFSCSKCGKNKTDVAESPW